MWPLVLEIGSFRLGSYGVLLVVAVLAALALAAWLARRDGLPPGKVVDLGVVTLFSGIFCAKLLGVVVALASGAPLDWSELRNTGAVHGGLLGGLLAAYLLARRFGFSFFALTDVYAPAAALGQGIGRLACFAAGCCFGSESGAPWAVVFHDPVARELGGVPLGVSLHPVQLYDALAHFALAALLVTLHKKRVFPGKLVGVWCIAEGLTRFSIESFRGDLGRGVWLELSWLSTGRLTAIGLFTLGVVLLVLRSVRIVASERPAAPSP